MPPSIVYQHITFGLISDNQQVLLNTSSAFENAVQNTKLISTVKLEGEFTTVTGNSPLLLIV